MKAIAMTNEELENFIKQIIYSDKIEEPRITEYRQKLRKQFEKLLEENEVKALVLIRKDTEALVIDNPDSFLDYLTIKY
jgi:molybdopterin-guanine dinucleotide biosynthesis protein A